MQDYYDTASVVGAAGALLTGGTVQYGTLAGIAARRGSRMAMSAISGRSKRSRREEGEGQSRDSKARYVTQGALTQLAYSYDTYGRVRSMRSVKADESLRIGQWVKYQFGTLTKNALGNSSGNLAYALRNVENDTLTISKAGEATQTVAGATEYPLHLYELTNRNDRDNDRVQPTDNVVGWYCYSDNASTTVPNLKFGPLVGKQNNDGTTNCNDWNIWSSSSETAAVNLTSYRNQASVLKEVEAELVLQGSNGSPTTFYISLLAISDNDYGPYANANYNRDEVFLPMIRKLLGNPITGVPLSRKNSRDTVKVLKTWEYYMNPSLTIDVDATPPMRHVKLNCHFNTSIQWNWVNSVNADTKTTVDEPNKYVSLISAPQAAYAVYPPNPKDRLMLVVRATSPNQQVAINALVPQYDIRLKATHVFADL